MDSQTIGEPLVSVIIPTRNTETYIGRCLESICSQTYSNLEIIVIDDCSTDSTKDILAGINDERLCVLNGGGNGVSHARNTGIDVANGEYLTFVDSDDWVSTEFIEHGISLAITNNLDVVIGGIAKHYADGSEHVLSVSEDSDLLTFEGDSLEAVRQFSIGYSSSVCPELNSSHMSGCCCRIIDSKMIDGIRFNENLSIGEDTVFNISYLRNPIRVGVAGEVWYYYRINSQSTVNSLRMHAFEEAEAMLACLREACVSGEKPYWDSRAIHQFIGAIKQSIYAGNVSIDIVENIIEEQLAKSFWAKCFSEMHVKELPMALKFKLFAYACKHGFSKMASFMFAMSNQAKVM